MQGYSDKLKVLMVGSLLVAGVLASIYGQESRLRWNGFLSVGAGMTLSNGEVFSTDGVTDAQYEDKLSFRGDTSFGLQAQIELEKRLSATAQMMGRGGDDFDVQLEWAYLTYEATDELNIYAGRRRLPMWLFSDGMEVGYTYHWIRPPMDLYRSPLTTYEGVSARYAHVLGDFDSHIEAFYGQTDLDRGPDVHIDIYHFSGLFWTVTQEPVQVRTGWAHAKHDTTVTVAPGVTVVSEGADLNYYTAALTLSSEKYFLISEFSRLDYERERNDFIAWYVSAGLHIDKFTPHLTFSELRESDNSRPAIVTETVTAGVRWDFHPSAALKLEYSSVRDHGDFTLDGDSEIIALAVDIVF